MLKKALNAYVSYGWNFLLDVVKFLAIRVENLDEAISICEFKSHRDYLTKLKKLREYEPTTKEKKARFDTIDEELMKVTNKPDRLLKWCVYYDEFKE